jgi:hypothetical protein
MKLVICSLLLLLSGCATLENYCDEHSRNCVVGTEIAVGVAVGVVAIAATHSGAKTKSQAPTAPLTTGCPSCQQ